MTIAEAAIQNGRRIVAPFKYYFLLERADRDLVTLEYSKIDRNIVIGDADVVFTTGDSPAWLMGTGFRKVAQFECQPRRVPWLPETFYLRSVFDDWVYRRN